MKYLILDTNIFLDMIIDRKNNVSKDLVNTFIKLLDFNQIKLVIPAIVVHETNKHIAQQLSEVGKNISGAIRAIDKIYGINGYSIKGLEVKEYKDSSKKELNILKVEYKQNSEKYSQEIKDILEKLIQHQNSEVIDDSVYNGACLQRRIYKKAPFHINNKDSYADGLITETLLHIGEIFPLAAKDEVIFVTGNTSDFSDINNKESLHEDIIKDIHEMGLYENVSYVTKFNKLVSVNLKAEVEEANLSDEFEKELRENEEIDRMLFEADIIDLERDSVGLPSLGCFEAQFESEFVESRFANDVVKLFERLNNCYDAADELYSFFSEDLPLLVSNIETHSINNFVSRWNEIVLDFPEYNLSNVRDICNLLDSVQNKEYIYSCLSEVEKLPDYLEWGFDNFIFGKEGNKYSLKMDTLNLSCASGSSDQLKIELFDNRNHLISSGIIDIFYGSVAFDEEQNVGDALEYYIEYHTEDLISELEIIVQHLESFVKDDKALLNIIDVSNFTD